MPSKPQYAHELSSSVKLHEEQLRNLTHEATDLRTRQEALKDQVTDIRRDLAVVQQQLADQLRRIEEWDRRWWGLVTLLVGALLSLAAGLIVTLVKK